MDKNNDNVRSRRTDRAAVSTPPIHLFLIIIFALFHSCEKPERNNPWDDGADPALWAPHDLVGITNPPGSVTITWRWDYKVPEPEGFYIYRKEGNEDWEEKFSQLGGSKRQFKDSTVNIYEHNYVYKMYAFLGKNRSIFSEIDIPMERYPDRYMGELQDIDGNTYQTVVIDDTWWMAENLKTTKYQNGTLIAYPGSDNTAWENNAVGAYAWYNNDIDDKETYGALYNWHAVNNSNGLCPEGWRVPSDAEWTALTDYLFSEYGKPNNNLVNGAGNALKSCRQVSSPLEGDCVTLQHPRWNAHNSHYGTDEFGFSALPGGYRTTDGIFYYKGLFGFWWTSTGSSADNAWYRSIYYDSGSVISNSFGSKGVGKAVRCIRD